MAIKIIDAPMDIYLTQAEHDKYRREYEKSCQFMVDPPSFEQFVRQRQDFKRYDI